MKRHFRRIHLWLSIPFGLIISLICFSGAMLTFETEITEWINRDLFYVNEVKTEKLPIGKLLNQAEHSLPDSVNITGLTIYPDKTRTYQASLSHPRRASILIDPYTGEVKGRNERLPFFSTMFRLHRWLLSEFKPGGGMSIGKLVVGISTLSFVFIVLSGLLLWLPRHFSSLKKSLKFNTGKGKKRLLRDLHVVLGVYFSVIFLCLTLTGLTWSFQWYRNGFYGLFGVKLTENTSGHGRPRASIAASNTPKVEQPSNTDPYAHWQTVYDQLSKTNPGKKLTITPGTASIALEPIGNARATDQYKFSIENGQILDTTPYKDSDPASKARGLVYSIHVGSWGGLFTRVLTFLAAMLGATLPFTGYYLWLSKKTKRKAHR